MQNAAKTFRFSIPPMFVQGNGALLVIQPLPATFRLYQDRFLSSEGKIKFMVIPKDDKELLKSEKMNFLIPASSLGSFLAPTVANAFRGKFMEQGHTMSLKVVENEIEWEAENDRGDIITLRTPMEQFNMVQEEIKKILPGLFGWTVSMDPGLLPYTLQSQDTLPLAVGVSQLPISEFTKLENVRFTSRSADVIQEEDH